MKDKTRYTSMSTENEGYAVLLEKDNIAIGEELALENSNETNHSSNAIPIRKSSNIKRRWHQAVASASAVLMKHLLEEEKNNKEKDDIDLFFDIMKGTVKKFNAGNKLLAKQRDFGVISDLEEFNLKKLTYSSSVTNVHQHY
ncbi:unnamed protein product [Diabrotica balteata]|uniref:Uncharacterized protein n=1 Tax=Diabrotica balteata TaxID=107213 RepID=A0A9N9T671_DIABA|nr:unnamed protein product [Diabrotica balteata]